MVNILRRNFANAPKNGWRGKSIRLVTKLTLLPHNDRAYLFRKYNRLSVSEYRSLFTVVTQVSQLSNICKKLENKKGRLCHGVFSYVTRLQRSQTSPNIE